MDELYEIAWDYRATEQLRKIYNYLSKKASREVEEKVRKELVSLTDKLERYPTANPLEPMLRFRPENYRFIKKWHYKIIYEVSGQLVTITYVWHIKQNPKKPIEAFKE